ncbi:hypothetical protein BCR33DRAFT_855452 [Rhizoclosmatium globosum]|uniref:Chitinase n=1 Tax=Rhizoclosmatium globosum TaxID=329046 RepID=A0A1Y2BN74_9FUNG|nr:hypothetical protein BCR33DRAFT_855452 [Rhizoclosmatium globosum]|eukprot:ORY36203.1 hypothetical protein BCR33DRAFT_855452 [Rhizoclosmatium globosum]
MPSTSSHYLSFLSFGSGSSSATAKHNDDLEQQNLRQSSETSLGLDAPPTSSRRNHKHAKRSRSNIAVLPMPSELSLQQPGLKVTLALQETLIQKQVILIRMLFAIIAVAAAAAVQVHALVNPPVDAFAGGYVLFGQKKKLQLLAESASTLPVNRVWLSFARPDMYYEPGSKNLVGVGLNYDESLPDHGFSEIKKYVGDLQAGGVEVFLSMGGWDYNCWPWAYALYSINNYGPGPTFSSTIGKFGGGNFANCNDANQWCYACEPPANGNTPNSFAVFPEPANSPTWKQAQVYVTKNNNFGVDPVWHPELVAGNTVEGHVVPGWNEWNKKGRDPYQDLVYLAKDLGLDGVDIDYEEFWHADKFKAGQANCGTGCTLYQTVFKYSAIMQDVRINAQNIYPSLKVSTAGSAAGAWAGTWWGGNLKGLTLNMAAAYPDLVQWIANSGGWNIMTYDLSNSAVNCPPAPASCSLDGQVQFYMSTYTSAGIPAAVGYEIGTPAYPPASDAEHLMPLSNSLAGEILSNTQPYYKNGFFWELFKPQGSKADVPVNALAQALCKQVLGPKTARCSGSIPILDDAPLPGSSNNVPVHPPIGPPPVGPATCYPPWDKTVQYKSPSDKCSYKGYNYHPKYWIDQNAAPGTSDAWFQEGICVASSSSASFTTAVTKTTSAIKTASTASVVGTSATQVSTSIPLKTLTTTSATFTIISATSTTSTSDWVT